MFHGRSYKHSQGGSRMISVGFDLVKLPYLLTYSDRKTWANNNTDQKAQNAASDLGLHC